MNNCKIPDLLCNYPFLYSNSKEDKGVCSIRIQLESAVNPDLLQDALQETLEEMPAYKVSIQYDKHDYYFVENNRACKVYDEKPRMLIKETNGYPYKLSYRGNELILELSHAVFDGAGAIHFLNGILLKYFQIEHEKKKEEICYTDIYSMDMLQDKKTNPIEREKAFQLLEDKVIRRNGLCLKLDKKKILERAEHLEVTPYIYVLFVVSYIFQEMNPSEKPVIASLPVDLRKMFGIESIIYNCVTNIDVDCSKALITDASEDREKKACEVLYREILKQLRKKNIFASLKNNAELIQFVKKEDYSLNIKKKIFNHAFDMSGHFSSFCFSYIDENYWNQDVIKNIQSIEMFAPQDTMLLFEVAEVPDALAMSITYHNEEKEYIAKLIKWLEEREILQDFHKVTDLEPKNLEYEEVTV